MGFARLHEQIGSVMGKPVEPEHPAADADMVQLTNTGLAVWRAGDEPSFTDGWRTWYLAEPDDIQAVANVVAPSMPTASPARSPVMTTGPPIGVWDRLAQCESNGNWASTSNPRYKGGLQMDSTFWARYGGLNYASAPQYATRAQQIAVAERGLAVQGYGAWPVCSRVVGLR
jgi:hypothetical protein